MEKDTPKSNWEEVVREAGRKPEGFMSEKPRTTMLTITKIQPKESHVLQNKGQWEITLKIK